MFTFNRSSISFLNEAHALFPKPNLLLNAQKLIFKSLTKFYGIYEN